MPSCRIFEMGLVWCVFWNSVRRSTISTAASDRFSTRDAIVSSYFEMKYRYTPDPSTKSFTLNEWIHNDRGGFMTIIAMYNNWAENKHRCKSSMFVRYEDLIGDTAGTMRPVMDFLGYEWLSDDAIGRAVVLSSKTEMGKLENNGSAHTNVLKPYVDKSGHAAPKVRKGKIGHYKDEMDAYTIAQLDKIMAEHLDPSFGYEGTEPE